MEPSAQLPLIGNPQPLLELLARMGLAAWSGQVMRRLTELLIDRPHGDLGRWQQALQQMPAVTPGSARLDVPRVRIGTEADLEQQQRAQLRDLLLTLHPWRKGPFELFGIEIDSEWRSDWKWRRLQSHIAPLAGRRVLDVGCGNGYYLWRMLGEGADAVLGIDPMLLFLAQFRALAQYLPDHPVGLLPFGIEDLPQDLHCCDTLFCMGVLYHRREPGPFLRHLRSALRPGGQLVLETLVLPHAAAGALVPKGRYAKMRNVWMVPAIPLLERWLRDAGFDSIDLVDVTVTSVQEQRATDWMHFESLIDFLDPEDHRRTVEGYPAPCRALLTASA